MPDDPSPPPPIPAVPSGRGDVAVADKPRKVRRTSAKQRSTATGRQDRRRLQHALERGESRYRVLFELNPCPMFIFDEDTLQLLDVNEAALQLYGWPRDEFLALSARDLRPAAEAARFAAVIERQRNSRAAYVGEWRHVTRRGTEFDAAITISSIPYAGRDARLVLVNDITERKRAEAELLRLNTTLEVQIAERTRALSTSETRFRSIYEHAATGIAILNVDTQFVQCNPAYCRMTGYGEAELRAMRLPDLLHPNDRAYKLKLIRELLRGARTSFEVDNRYVCKHGGTSWGHKFVSVLPGARPQDNLLIVLATDITDRKRLERELLEIGERERQQVGNELHDDLGQILHGVHFLAAAVQKQLAARSAEEAKDLDRMIRYLDEAIATTRAVAHGLQPVPPMPEGLMVALREHASRVRKLYPVKCRFVCPKPVLISDRLVSTHLFRIAQEAVTNAIKHARCKQITLWLAAATGRIVLGVWDDGHGRLPAPGKRRGMGLHVMQFRAGAINGSLVVQRAARGGTEVVCTVEPVSEPIGRRARRRRTETPP